MDQNTMFNPEEIPLMAAEDITKKIEEYEQRNTIHIIPTA